MSNILVAFRSISGGLELTTVVTTEGAGGIKFWVVDASGKIESGNTQKLSFDVSLGAPDSPWITAVPGYQPKRGVYAWGGIPHGSVPGYPVPNAPPHFVPGWADYEAAFMAMNAAAAAEAAAETAEEAAAAAAEAVEEPAEQQ